MTPYKTHTDGRMASLSTRARILITSVALLDALKAVGIPAVEVHISDPDAREEFRRVSYIRAACVGTVKGHGFQGYIEALQLLYKRLIRQ